MAQILVIYIDSTMRTYDHHFDSDFRLYYKPEFGEPTPLCHLPYEERCELIMVQLFRFLQAKDTFINLYIQLLSERLIDQLSKGGIERETELVNRFKVECGDVFAN